MSGQANDIQWYIARDGKQHGPLTDIEMRTFVSHSYLRVSDLIWHPGMPEWQSAPSLFPEAFPGSEQASEHSGLQANGDGQAKSARTAATASRGKTDARHSDFDNATEPSAERGTLVKRLVLASVAVTLIGGGAFALATYHEPLMNMVSGSAKKSDTPPPVVSAPVANVETPAAPPADPTPPAQSAASDASSSASPSNAPPSEPTTSSVPSSDNARTQVANADPQSGVPSGPPSIDGSATDVKLRKVPVWALIKREYPDWYSNEVTAANKLVADNKSDNDVAALLAQGLVNLRRQNADKALAASSEKLQKIAVAFLDHLKALRAQSVSACFGFISRGETSPAVVQMLENPEGATALNAQADAIFEAISEGGKNPVKHDSAVKSDYDMLIKELAKLGWKEEDLQVFSNPKLLAKREPEQVCKMVQEWFVAHLAVQDKAVRDRLLFETLKPVVSG